MGTGQNPAEVVLVIGSGLELVAWFVVFVEASVEDDVLDADSIFSKCDKSSIKISPVSFWHCLGKVSQTGKPPATQLLKSVG
ncbi:MAG TPA: hypothetical protein PKW34_01960 [Candidatus Paceibacterota bacterium]|nr:hypothetical protein [Candidatus Paceibacterota bacterium]